jgi:hypothetical protein
MSERWTCTRCSRENDPWAVGCSGCGTVRADLSVAGSQPEPPAATVPPGDVAPTVAQPTDAEPIDAQRTDVPPSDAQAAPTWPLPAAAQPPSQPDPAAQSAPIWDVATSEPPASVPFWQRLPLGWIIIGVFVVAGAVGGLIFNASRDASGAITKSGDLDPAELRVGDCFDLKDPSADEVEKVTALPCSSEHEYEMFHVGSMADGAFPTDDAFLEWLGGNCVPAFGTYVGTVYEESELEIFWLQPTSDGWNDGDRSIQCAVYHPRVHRVTESVKGSAQ